MSSSSQKCFQDRTDVFIVLQYEENGSLFDLMNRMTKLPLDFAQNVIVELCIGLKFLHERNFVHGDLKPENVLLDSNLRVHLVDFGLTLKLNERGFVGIWGTPTYQSPEQLAGKMWNHRTDYFCAGIIFMIMVTGCHPFNEKSGTDDAVAENIRRLKYTMPQIKCTNVQSFILKTLCRQDTRLKYNDVLEHPFIEPLVSKLIETNGPDCTLFLTEQQSKMYVDNINFFQPISGLDLKESLWGAEVSKFCNN